MIFLYKALWYRETHGNTGTPVVFTCVLAAWKLQIVIVLYVFSRKHHIE